MNKIKDKYKRIKDTVTKKLFIADLLLIISFFIIFFTTFTWNKYIAMYILGAAVFALSYFVQKGRK
ncbi:hypothetical protein M4I33_13125 [Clostridium sp. LY3-2]|uniref:hypothetical protein n=1 Tax=Clostridium sp. LY3-2 TaxID=2942482 RepID=UPI00215272FF|nr:hypothetical protein [Clostridium sp. LY3-2]MCR6515812.1 hypothetical protein [Clostridium sp. LY3-2]